LAIIQPPQRAETIMARSSRRVRRRRRASTMLLNFGPLGIILQTDLHLREGER
jgi:hypothetical protein